MTVRELVSATGFEPLALPREDKTVQGVYAGDLLSWVMGRAKADDVWITIMSNNNIVAVASLVDMACILLAEGVEPEEDLVALAREKEVNLLKSPYSTYETALRLGALMREDS